MSEIIQAQYCDEMQKSYLDYSMSVITDRAVVDVRDGLKPVQRRTIYAMYKLGLLNSKPHRKSARIVGDTMGKYHPHGDSSIYESLVVMQQEFKKKIALVDGHGNFGSVEGDTAAAMRYTEARLQEFTYDVYLADIDKDIVDFKSNFDDTEVEPVVLGAKLPMTLINGSDGIAVGMTTSITPHNLDEVIDAMKLILSNENVSDSKLLTTIKGPDFPLPCEITNSRELKKIYSSGHGKLIVRGLMHTESNKGKECIVIDSLPPSQIGQGIGRFLDDLVLLNDKRLTNDISDIRNETDEEGIRIVIEVKKDGDVEFIKKLIKAKTRYTDTLSISMLVINKGKAEVMNLRKILNTHIEFLIETQLRKFKYLLDKTRDREEVLDGLIKAVDIIDIIIEIIRGSKNIEIAKGCLINGDTTNVVFKNKSSEKIAKTFYFTPIQAQAILDMKLSKLIGLEIMALKEDYAKVLSEIEEYEKLLNDKDYLNKNIKLELNRLKKKYHQERITILSDVEKENFTFEEKEELLGIEIDSNGYIKADKPKDHTLVSSSFDKLIFFTSRGRQLQIKVKDIPKKSDNIKGTPIEKLCDFDRNEEEILYISSQDNLSNNLVFITKNGLAKVVGKEEFIVTVQKSKATKLKDGDELVYVDEVIDDDILIVDTGKKRKLKVNVCDIKKYGKNTQGSHICKNVVSVYKNNM